MTKIGNPGIGMVWTCLRNVRTPIKGKLSPLNGQDIWELGNVTVPADQELEEVNWKLVPVLRQPDQEHIKAVFTSDLALGYCKMQNVGAIPEATVPPQYGVRYVTVTSTIAESVLSEAAMATPEPQGSGVALSPSTTRSIANPSDMTSGASIPTQSRSTTAPIGIPKHRKA
jgi:hypothetical protein